LVGRLETTEVGRNRTKSNYSEESARASETVRLEGIG